VFQKGRHKTYGGNSVNSQTIFNFFSLSGSAVNLQLPVKKTHMRRYTTLRSCETLMSENERQSQTNAVINDKLQGTVVTYLGCGGISITNLRQVYC